MASVIGSSNRSWAAGKGVIYQSFGPAANMSWPAERITIHALERAAATAVPAVRSGHLRRFGSDKGRWMWMDEHSCGESLKVEQSPIGYRLPAHRDKKSALM
jgi:hypothetical protein